MKTDPGCDEILQRERRIVASAYDSKKGIRGAPNFADRLVIKSDYNSKENIKGTIRPATSELDYFTKYKTPEVDEKHKVEKSGVDEGEYNYEDEMFKK